MAKTPKKVKKEKVEVPEETTTIEPLFTITIKIENATYEGKGETAFEALKSVPVPPLDFISSGSVVVTKGESHREMFYSTMQLKRLLNPYHQEVLAHILTEGM